MSDLSVTIAPSGLVGLEADKVVNAPKVELVESETNINAISNDSDNVKQALAKENEAANIAPEEVKEALVDMNSAMQNMQRNLSFTIDEQLGEAIVSVTDVETEEVIRQIPSEELVVLRKKLDDVVGILFDTKV